MPNHAIVNRAPFSYSKGDLVAGKYLLESLLDQGGMGAHSEDADGELKVPH